MPDDAAETRLLHLIHRLFAQHGGTLDETALAKRLHRLQLGIPRQDEFAALLYWLARCELAHQFDQSYPVGTEYQVPDLFAILRERIPTVGRPVPAPGVLLAGVVVVLLGLFPGVAWTLAATR